jgi:hypothetical protein
MRCCPVLLLLVRGRAVNISAFNETERGADLPIRSNIIAAVCFTNSVGRRPQQLNDINSNRHSNPRQCVET